MANVNIGELKGRPNIALELRKTKVRYCKTIHLEEFAQMNLITKAFTASLCDFVILIFGVQLALAGNWDNTKHAVVLKDKLYTIEVSGTLYVTDLSTGKWTQLGKPDFAKTNFLFATTSNLVTIESDGNLYLIDPNTGSWKGIGKAGNWKRTMVGATIGERLYTVESEGALFETNTSTGAWRQIGNTDFVRTKFFFANANSLFSIEHIGDFFSIDPATGVKQRIGSSNDWSETIRGTVHGGKLFSKESNGGIYETDTASGRWKKIGNSDFVKSNFLFAAGGSLYTIDFSGDLFRLDSADQRWVQIGK